MGLWCTLGLEVSRLLNRVHLGIILPNTLQFCYFLILSDSSILVIKELWIQL